MLHAYKEVLKVNQHQVAECAIQVNQYQVAECVIPQSQ